MQKETLIREEPLVINGYSLMPVVKLLITCVQDKGRCTYLASMQPVYLLVSFNGRTHALTADGCEIPLDRVEAELRHYDLSRKVS
jgi:hypothetical protein